jgi:hypothetical protein
MVISNHPNVKAEDHWMSVAANMQNGVGFQDRIRVNDLWTKTSEYVHVSYATCGPGTYLSPHGFKTYEDYSGSNWEISG